MYNSTSTMLGTYTLYLQPEDNVISDSRTQGTEDWQRTLYRSEGASIVDQLTKFNEYYPGGKDGRLKPRTTFTHP